MAAQVFSLKIGGEAGFGIMSAGETVSKLAMRAGYFVNDYAEYPSIVRGGHNVVQISISPEKVRSPLLATHLLVALNQETIDKHWEEMIELRVEDAEERRDNGQPQTVSEQVGDTAPATNVVGPWVVFDSEDKMRLEGVNEKIVGIDIPFTRIAREVGGLKIMRNAVAVAAALALMGGNLQRLLDMLSEEFAKKGDEVIAKNHAVARAGYDYVMEHYSDKVASFLADREVKQQQVLVNGNQATALGAIAAGCQFVSIYPMTPTSSILEWMAPYQEKYGFIYRQPEDEISAINMAIGASFAGARSMCATSGGGFCLMTEGYGLAGITETPLVIIEGQRGSPATGLPTWTEQGDLRFVLHAHQGDFPRIVLSASDQEEAFYLTMKAFYLADKYQTPVVLLTDKHICEGHMSVDEFVYKDYLYDRGKMVWKAGELGNGKLKMESEHQQLGSTALRDNGASNYRRYGWSEDGISVRTVPGSGLHFVANSDEHDDEGFSNEEADNRKRQMDKRMRKLVMCEKLDMEAPLVFGAEDAEVTIVSWGSNKGAILDAMEILPPVVKLVHVQWMSPFPSEAVKKHLDSAKYVLNIEGNYSMQFGGLVAEKTGVKILDNMVKYDGRPFFPREIVEKVQSILGR